MKLGERDLYQTAGAKSPFAQALQVASGSSALSTETSIFWRWERKSLLRGLQQPCRLWTRELEVMRWRKIYQNFKRADEDRRKLPPERSSYSQNQTECCKGPQALSTPLGARARISAQASRSWPPSSCCTASWVHRTDTAGQRHVPPARAGQQNLARGPFLSAHGMFDINFRKSKRETDGLAQALEIRSGQMTLKDVPFFHQNAMAGACPGSSKRRPSPVSFEGNGGCSP